MIARGSWSRSTLPLPAMGHDPFLLSSALCKPRAGSTSVPLTRAALSLQRAQVIVQAIEPRVPELAVVGQPRIDAAQRAGRQAAWPPLRRPRTCDEAGALEHLQMLGNGRPADLEGLGQLVDAHLAAGQAGENGAPGRIG